MSGPTETPIVFSSGFKEVWKAIGNQATPEECWPRFIAQYHDLTSDWVRAKFHDCVKSKPYVHISMSGSMPRLTPENFELIYLPRDEQLHPSYRQWLASFNPPPIVHRRVSLPPKMNFVPQSRCCQSPPPPPPKVSTVASMEEFVVKDEWIAEDPDVTAISSCHSFDKNNNSPHRPGRQIQSKQFRQSKEPMSHRRRSSESSTRHSTVYRHVCRERNRPDARVWQEGNDLKMTNTYPPISFSEGPYAKLTTEEMEWLAKQFHQPHSSQSHNRRHH